MLILLHVLLIQRLGISVPPSVEAESKSIIKPVREMRFFPNFLLREMIAWYTALGVLGALAALFPWNLGVKADPFAAAPAGIKPEWYFLFMFQTLKLIPSKVWFVDGEVLGVLGFGLAGLIWLMLPFFESAPPAKAKPSITGLAVFALAYIAGMSVYGYFAK